MANAARQQVMAETQRRMANSPQWLQNVVTTYSQLPEFVREDLLEGILVGGGIAIPVAFMGEQDPAERLAAVLGGIGAATLGGAASRRIGAAIGSRLRPDALPQGSFGYNLGRVMGREDMLLDTATDMLGISAAPQITGREYGRAIGRAVGDEVFGVAGTLGALAAAQAMDSTPDETPQPTMGEVAMATIPGAVIGTALSGLTGGMIDTVGLNRAQLSGEEPQTMEDLGEFLRRHTVFAKKGQG